MQIITKRGGKSLIDNLSIIVDNEIYKLDSDTNLSSQYNIKYIFKIEESDGNFPESIFGEKLFDVNFQNVRLNKNSKVLIRSFDNLLSEDINLNFFGNETSFTASFFLDKAVNNYNVLEALPIPIQMLTIIISFQSTENRITPTLKINKFLDGYSHLGFILVDIERMRKIVFEDYGDVEVDLIDEFANSEIIDKLFLNGVIIIVWGINPFVYPIYSTENLDITKELLGKSFNRKGVYHLDETITELSIIPGHELRKWPKCLNKKWPIITLYGKGNYACIEPFYLEDKDHEKIISSFLIYREGRDYGETSPLLNIDLLY
ncbi:hypothetical protein [Flavobacterium branchiicola]|uniref:Uncharacterized protein n=1 Tax=Flavobacterium branchiicola TaxID=1114875 RepID=A0ABV9PCT3_9FLAO|nr:hypothetical protein [Flavobacterium branchiicola]MBS7253689.1 hypothetical protein [Flavobacterium branchiicola]